MNLNILKEDGNSDPDVWAIGDAAIIENQVLPATAQGMILIRAFSDDDFLSIACLVANQKGRYLAIHLNKIVKGRKSDKPFEFHNMGSLAYIGDWFVSDVFDVDENELIF